MKCYIGLGGIGCRTLQTFEENVHDKEDKLFFYIDSDRGTDTGLTTAEKMYVVPGISCGTAMLRNIGRNSMNYEIFNGHIHRYFSRLDQAKDVELIFVLSSFGGFGSAALVPLLDYLEAITWTRLKSCLVIAFNENMYTKSQGFPEKMVKQFELNTIEFVNDLCSREQQLDCFISNHFTVFNPGCTSFLIDTAGITPNVFWKYLESTPEELSRFDCKKEKRVKPPKTVFISFSSKDQDIADMVADELRTSDIQTWSYNKKSKAGTYAKQIVQAIREASVVLVLISKNSVGSEHVKNEIDIAFKRVNDGLVLIPFILDDSELDDELLYYLCRQEMIPGTRPPLEERIRDLVTLIQDII